MKSYTKGDIKHPFSYKLLLKKTAKKTKEITPIKAI
mgnify:CR=1 FL=1